MGVYLLNATFIVFGDNKPARAAFQVSALPKVPKGNYSLQKKLICCFVQGAKVEIEAVAVVGNIIDA